MNAKQRKMELGSEFVDAVEGIMRAVEGVGGALDYGTFRGEKAGMRFKDTPEWVKFYVAWSRMKDSVSHPLILSQPHQNRRGESG